MTRRKDAYTSTAPVSPADALASCQSKTRYENKNMARDVGVKAGKARGVELRPYRCLLCNGYHLTHYSAKAGGNVRRLIRSRGTA